MISKSISVVLGILSLLALALPTGVVSQTAQAQSLGSDIANDVLDNIDQDSSANDNVLVNEDEFGDDTQVAVPITDQEQTAANLAANLDVEIESIQPTPTTPTPTPTEPPEEEDAFFCFPVMNIACFESLAECQEAAERIGGECRGFETLPEGALLCTFEEGQIICQV
jgi:hypothetical protein